MGHTSLATTQRYLEATPTELRSAVRGQAFWRLVYFYVHARFGARRIRRHHPQGVLTFRHHSEKEFSPDVVDPRSQRLIRQCSRGWIGPATLRQPDEVDFTHGGRVLGDREFAARVAMQVRRHGDELRSEMAAQPASLEEIALEVSAAVGVRVEELRGSGRCRPITRARELFVRKAVMEHGLRTVDVARHLRISTAAVAAYRRKLTN